MASQSSGAYLTMIAAIIGVLGLFLYLYVTDWRRAAKWRRARRRAQLDR